MIFGMSSLIFILSEFISCSSVVEEEHPVSSSGSPLWTEQGSSGYQLIMPNRSLWKLRTAAPSPTNTFICIGFAVFHTDSCTNIYLEQQCNGRTLPHNGFHKGIQWDQVTLKNSNHTEELTYHQWGRFHLAFSPSGNNMATENKVPFPNPTRDRQQNSFKSSPKNQVTQDHWSG